MLDHQPGDPTSPASIPETLSAYNVVPASSESITAAGMAVCRRLLMLNIFT
jgi:hypothetical protein